MAVLVVGCQTYEAVTSAPPDFWLTAEAIVVAVCLDLWQLIEWLL